MPIGTFTQSTACQPNHSVSTPPRIEPAAPPAPATAPQTPSARLRSLPAGNSVISSERAAGEMRAAPMPCAARETTSMSGVTESAPAIDATTKRPRPAMKTRRRPVRSAIRPPSSRNPPKVSV